MPATSKSAIGTARSKRFGSDMATRLSSVIGTVVSSAWKRSIEWLQDDEPIPWDDPDFYVMMFICIAGETIWFLEIL